MSDSNENKLSMNEIDPSHKCGYLYVAFGEKYLKELNTAVRSLRDYTALPIALITDDKSYENHPDFSRVIIHEPIYSYGGKIYCLIKSPFEKTIFLDTDTFVCGSLDGIFDLLDRFDVAAVLSNIPFSTDFIAASNSQYVIHYPDFTEYNTGLIGIHNVRSKEFLLSWKRKYEELQIKTDQVAFRDALLESNVRVATLPFEYNFMGLNSYSVANSRIKVLHGRYKSRISDMRSTVASYEEMKKVATRANSLTTKRIFMSQSIRPVSAGWNLTRLKNKLKKIVGVKLRSKRKTL